MKKGSLSIYAILSLVLVLSFLFTLLEASRRHQMHVIARLNTEAVAESIMGNFEKQLWEQYGILALDDGEESDQEAFMEWEWYAKELSDCEFASEGTWGGSNHFRRKTSRVSFEQYRLLTDDDGKAYLASVSAYMQAHLAKQVMDELKEEYQILSNMEVKESPDDSAISAADAAIEEAASAAEERNQTEGDQEQIVEETGVEAEDNPLTFIRDLWGKGILSIAVKNPKTVSKAKEKLNDTVSKRKLSAGTYSKSLQTNAMDSLLFAAYLNRTFACYTKGEAKGALQYELEYLLCGKAKDSDNLAETVERLLAVREAANLAYLASDVTKQELAYSLAITLAGVTVNPTIIYAVKAGIIAAWAMVESVLDVRALLEGDRIAIVKTSAQWTSDLLHLGSAFSDFGKAKNCANGLTYERYLGFLLMLNENKCAYRAMDLQEMAIRKTEGNEHFRMDHMVVDLVLSIDYQYKSIFAGREKLSVPTMCEYSYRKAGV